MGWSSSIGWNNAGWSSPPASGPTGPTWDPFAKSSLVVLSNGNLTATSVTVTETQNNVLSTTSHDGSGKYYLEVTATTLAGTDNESAGIGIADSSFVITTDYVGSTNHSVGYYANGVVLINTFTVGTISSYVQGDVIGIALDLDHGTLWFRVNSGDWNNDPTANPASNTGGLGIGALSSPDRFVAAEIEETTEAFTVNFAGSFAFAPPSGFGLGKWHITM